MQVNTSVDSTISVDRCSVLQIFDKLLYNQKAPWDHWKIQEKRTRAKLAMMRICSSDCNTQKKRKLARPLVVDIVKKL